MSQEVIHRTASISADLQEKVLLTGDLSKLSSAERLSYYNAVCESVGLNPLTQPFQYLILGKGEDRKMVLYAKKDCTDQLRDMPQHHISVHIVSREVVEGVYVVTAQAMNKDGRTDESVGAVPLVKENGQWRQGQNNRSYFEGDGTYKPLSPDDKANAMMKAETKAKRRVTLSICGLGMLDETEIETIRDAKVVPMDSGGKTSDQKFKAISSVLEPTVDEVLKDMGQDGLEVSTPQETPNPASQDAAPTNDIFASASAVADHSVALNEARHDADVLQRTWDDIVKDKRLAQHDRAGLYTLYQKLSKALKGKK